MSKSSDDRLTISPAGPFTGEMTIPGDKSISHRAVMLGAIAKGKTVIEGFLEGDDNLTTISAFRSMGVSIDGPTNGKLTVSGVGLMGLKAPGAVVDCGNSGTTARLLSGILAAQNFRTTLIGDNSLKNRPMKRIVEPLKVMGANIKGEDEGEHLPLTIDGSALKGIHYKPPIASAQVKSCILLAGLYADGETSVDEPAKSRDHTERMLECFGADISIDGRKATVRKSKGLKGCKVVVPGDISSAAFFMVAAAVTPGSEILIKNVGVNPTRTGIISVLMKMGASVDAVNEQSVCGEPVADIAVKYSKLKGVDITGAELLPAIDEFPAICVAAAFAEGTTTINGAGELRVKESDRISAMATALTAIGIDVKEHQGGLSIEGRGGEGRGGEGKGGEGTGGKVAGGEVASLGDHRIAMAMAVVGAASEKGVSIIGTSCVDVSFPGFFDLFDSARVGSN